MNRTTPATVAVLIVGAVLGALILRIEPQAVADEHDHDHGHGGHEEEEFERGPHGGRMLEDGNVALEMSIFEDGVPPEFHVYVTVDDKPVSPVGVTLEVELQRLGGRVDAMTFEAEGTFLRSRQTVIEPHSFDVVVRAKVAGGTHTWTYESHEGRVEISPVAAEAAGLKTAQAGPAQIRTLVHVTGQIILDPARSAKVKARFPGVLRELRKSLGDRVVKGETIGTIESSESLQPYAVKAPIDGTVITQNAVAGEVVDQETIFDIADLGQVAAELHVFPRDIAAVRAGQPVRVISTGADLEADSSIAVVLPSADMVSQAVPVRVGLTNADGRWRPGMVVSGEIEVGTKMVPLAVQATGLQTFREFDVVFEKVGNTYEVRMLELGANDGETVEVVSGIDPGAVYVSANSYLIKADILKSGASHDH